MTAHQFAQAGAIGETFWGSCVCGWGTSSTRDLSRAEGPRAHIERVQQRMEKHIRQGTAAPSSGVDDD